LEDGQLIISVTGTAGYSYSIDAVTFQSDSIFSQLGQGNFLITVKDHDGCIDEQNVDLVDSCNQPFFLPSAFTPNGDGINDRLNIVFSGKHLEVDEILLYNRWGEVVLHNKPGSITSGFPLWDGYYKENCVKGVFTYRILIRTTAGNSHVYVGTVLAL
jgi:gliding motility-associated-like protein